MKLKQLLAGLAAFPLLAGVGMAGQPAPLADAQMDQVTAGLVITITPTTGSVVSSCSPGGVNCTSTPVTVTLNYKVSDGATGLASFGTLSSAPLGKVECGRTTITIGGAAVGC